MTVEVGSASYSFDVSFENGVSSLKKIDSAIDSTNKNLKNFDTQATATARGVNRAFQQNIQNASFQVQDFAVQIASGQSAMLAFTQQLPQLIGGFGLLGAGIATAVAVFGGLYLAFGDAATNAEKLEKAIEGVQAVITVGAGQVANYTEEMQKLAGLSETLARLRLATAIADQNEAIKLSIEGIRDSLDDTRGSFDTYTDQVENLLGVQAGTNGFAAAEMAFRQYSAAVSTFSSSGDVERLESSLLALTEAGAQNTAIGRQLISQTVELIQRYREGQITIETLNKAIDGNTQEIIENNNAYNALNDELDTYFDLESGLFSADYKQRISDVNDELDQYFEREKAIADLQNQRARQQAKNVANRVINRGLSEDERFAQEVETLTQLRQRNLIEQQLYDQAIVSSAEQRAQRLNQIAENQQALQAQQTSMILGSTSQIFGGIADILRNSKGEQSDAFKAMFLLSKGFAIAQASLNLSTAIGNALAIPFPANIPAIAQATAAGTQIVSAVQGASYSGARQFGGPVSQGKPYLVGERGPEIVVPSGNGTVISNNDAFGGMGNVEVNVYGVPSELGKPDVNVIDRRIDIKFNKFYSDISQGKGQGAKAFRSGTNLNFQSNR